MSTEIPAAAVAAAVGTSAELGVGCVLNPAPVVHAVVGLLELGPLLTLNAGELTDLVLMAGGSGAVAPATPDGRRVVAAHRDRRRRWW